MRCVELDDSKFKSASKNGYLYLNITIETFAFYITDLSADCGYI